MLADRLVDQLARDLKPVRRRTAAWDATVLALVCGLELALFVALGQLRPDMPLAVELPSFWWKLTSLGVIATLGSVIAIRSFDPVKSPRRGLAGIVMVLAACLAAGWAVDSMRGGLPSLLERLDWADGLQCVCEVVVLSLPAVIGLTILMRRGAPADPAGTALTVGIASAAWGAFVFVFACPYDDPLYIAVWYGAAFGLVTVPARLVLPLLSRW